MRQPNETITPRQRTPSQVGAGEDADLREGVPMQLVQSTGKRQTAIGTDDRREDQVITADEVYVYFSSDP